MKTSLQGNSLSHLQQFPANSLDISESAFSSLKMRHRWGMSAAKRSCPRDTTEEQCSCSLSFNLGLCQTRGSCDNTSYSNPLLLRWEISEGLNIAREIQLCISQCLSIKFSMQSAGSILIKRHLCERKQEIRWWLKSHSFGFCQRKKAYRHDTWQHHKWQKGWV